MKQKNLNAKHNSFLQDKLIFSIYSSFEQIIQQYINNKKFVVCVSGGPDSLALAYCAKVYSEKFKSPYFFIIVDHGIRTNSSKEAKEVRDNLLKISASAKILKVKKKISTSIQKNARDHRYQLISDFCKKHKISFMLTAHHLDDQIENFYIRLSRGSGLYGLSSMKVIEKNTHNINVLRPFLQQSKKELIHVAKKVFKTFVKDPSNTNDAFLRSRIRKLKSSLAKEGLDQNRILKTISNLSSAKDAVDFFVHQARKKYIHSSSKNIIQIDRNLFTKQPFEITYRVMADLIRAKSGKDYPPRSTGLEYLIGTIRQKNFSKVTLGGFVFSLSKNKINMSKEHRNA